MPSGPIVDAAYSHRRAALLDQLLELFLAEGFMGFTMDELSARLHCSKTTLYALSPSKEQLGRTVVVYFFRQVAEAVESKVAQVREPELRVVRYLTAVAEELAPAGVTFYRDLERFAPGREVYERNTELAADRVRQLIAEGVAAGAFRDVHAVFVSDLVASAMRRIGSGQVTASIGLDTATAYRELADLVLHGISLGGADSQ